MTMNDDSPRRYQNKHLKDTSKHDNGNNVSTLLPPKVLNFEAVSGVSDGNRRPFPLGNKPMIIKSGTLLKWSGYLSGVIRFPWQPRQVELKPGVMVIRNPMAPHSEEKLIPLSVKNQSVFTADPHTNSWIVTVPHKDSKIHLKVPAEDPSDSFNLWNRALNKARDHYKDDMLKLGYQQQSSTTSSNSRFQNASFDPNIMNDDKEYLMFSDHEEVLNPLEQLVEVQADLKQAITSINYLYRKHYHSTVSLLQITKSMTGGGDINISKLNNHGKQTLAIGHEIQRSHSNISQCLDKMNSSLSLAVEQHRLAGKQMKKYIESAARWKNKYEKAKRTCALEHQKLPSSNPGDVIGGTIGVSDINGVDVISHSQSHNHMFDEEDSEDEFTDFESLEDSDDSADQNLFILQSREQQENSNKIVTMPEMTMKTHRGYPRRTHLPRPRSEFKISWWSTLKECVGRDIGRVALPVTFNEPTSFLQRAVEDFQYKELLDLAVTRQGPLKRFKNISDRTISATYLAAFLISPFSSSLGRTFKPFNPLLGETYEIKHLGFKYLAEQVTHHPPALAFHCFADKEDLNSTDPNIGWTAHGNLSVNQNFTGKSLSIQMKGEYGFELDFGGNEKKQKWNVTRPMMSIDNIILGKFVIDLYGQAVAKSDDGYCIIIEYIRRGWWSSNENQFKATIYQAKNGFGKPLVYLYGSWATEVYFEEITNSSHLADLPEITPELVQMARRRGTPMVPVAFDQFRTDKDTKTLLWKNEVRPSHSSIYYEFSSMTYQLNELSFDYNPKNGCIIAPTDSRFRPDQRLLEEGESIKANAVKRVLEEKQRAATRQREHGEASWQPVWFEKNPDLTDFFSGEAVFPYKGNYWELKKNGNQDSLNEICPDIFLMQDEIDAVEC